MKKLLPFLFLIALAACKKKDTTWNTDWVAPAVNDTLRLTSLFNDSTLVAGASNSINVDLKLILITEELSFIPDNIINCCQVIKVPRPSRNIYNRCLKTKINKTFKLDEITNIKNI